MLSWADEETPPDAPVFALGQVSDFSFIASTGTFALATYVTHLVFAATHVSLRLLARDARWA